MAVPITGPTPLPPSRYDFDPTDWPDDDCVVAGADLEPSTIVDAYRHGAFPMPQAGHLLWWSPVHRGVLEPGPPGRLDRRGHPGRLCRAAPPGLGTLRRDP